MFPYPILSNALPHSSYTAGTSLKFYIKVYNMKLSLIFRPNGDSLNFQNMSIKWQVPGGWGWGGEGNSHIKGTRIVYVSLGEKIDRFWSPFGLLKIESHYF